MKNKLLIPLLSIALLTGCASLFSGVITVTKVVDNAMQQWAQLSVSHQTTPEFDAKIEAAHDKYRQSAAVAEVLIQSYKAGSSTNTVDSALQVAKDGATPLIDLITSIIQPTQATSIKANLQKASQP